MEEKITKMLEIMTEIVDDDTKTWRDKKDIMLTVAQRDPHHEMVLEELASWFEG